jgi:hypothetical protein
MDLGKTLAELREQRDRIDQAILSLERLANSAPRGRGRPPGSRSKTRGKPEAVPRENGKDRMKAVPD